MATVDTSRPDGVNHGRRVVAVWLLLSVIATPIAILVVGPLIPPGNGSVQAQGQVFDNQVLIGVSAPVIAFVVVVLGYTLFAFRERDAAVVGPPVRGDSRLQLLWIVITSATVL